MQERMYVYIMANANDSTLYTGVTNDLLRRVHEHKEHPREGFTKRYNITKLLYYEAFDDPVSAIRREKQIKAGSRAKKEALIESVNPGWNDLWDRLVGGCP